MVEHLIRMVEVRFLVGLVCLLSIVAILIDAFEAVLLPRRVTHGYRFLRFFYRYSWRGWRRLVACVVSSRRRETLLSLFGPLALLVLFCTWAIGLIVAFAFLQWSLRTPMMPGASPQGPGGYLYFSGVTFFTLGYGDLTPVDELGRFLAGVETGLGFGFLAMVISYHPVLTQGIFQERRDRDFCCFDSRARADHPHGSLKFSFDLEIRNRRRRWEPNWPPGKPGR